MRRVIFWLGVYSTYLPQNSVKGPIMPEDLTEDQQAQVRAHVESVIEDSATAPSEWHYDYQRGRRVSVHVFYTDDAELDQVRESGETEQIKARLKQDMPETFAFLRDYWILVVFDSMEAVEKMGGWINYYK
jgi:hypothetical protein